jgi:hypothetical protein
MRWEHDVQHLTKAEIMTAIDCDVWQAFRISLKGTSTKTKLDRLNDWLEHEQLCKHCEEWKQVQVDNYINALKRGGQLDLAGNIVR